MPGVGRLPTAGEETRLSRPGVQSCGFPVDAARPAGIPWRVGVSGGLVPPQRHQECPEGGGARAAAPDESETPMALPVSLLPSYFGHRRWTVTRCQLSLTRLASGARTFAPKRPLSRHPHKQSTQNPTRTVCLRVHPLHRDAAPHSSDTSRRRLALQPHGRERPRLDGPVAAARRH